MSFRANRADTPILSDNRLPLDLPYYTSLIFLGAYRQLHWYLFCVVMYYIVLHINLVVNFMQLQCYPYYACLAQKASSCAADDTGTHPLTADAFGNIWPRNAIASSKKARP